MPDSPNRVAIERVDWPQVLPVLRLTRAFRYALQPGKLVVALLAVLLLHLVGLGLGGVWGDADVPTPQKPDGLVSYRSDGNGGTLNPYETLLAVEAESFRKLMNAAVNLDHGFGAGEPGVADALYTMVAAAPRALFDQHPWFAIVYGSVVLCILMLAGGVICRLAATQVCMQQMTSLQKATAFVGRRWGWYLLTPLMPAALALFLGLILMVAGLVFFNAPVLDIVGSVLLGVFLLLGFVIALVTIVLLFSLFLMPPAISVDGTDGFDAVSRLFNYVLYKPWQYAGYLLGSVIYLAAVYVLLAMLAELTVQATHGFVGVGAFAGSGISDDITRYEAITQVPDLEDQTASGALVTSAWIASRWMDLLLVVVFGVLFSVFCCLQTQVYVLMRRLADGTPLNECADEGAKDPYSSPEDMVDHEVLAQAAKEQLGRPNPNAEPQADEPAAADTPSEDKPADDKPSES